MGCCLWIKHKLEDALTVLWKSFPDLIWRVRATIFFSLLFYSNPFREFCIVALTFMSGAQPSVHIDIKAQFTGQGLFCVQVHQSFPSWELAGGILFLFLSTNYIQGWRSKTSSATTKTGYYVFCFFQGFFALMVKTPSSLQQESTMKVYTAQTFNHSADDTVHPVLFL